jgi:hypothetical protein
MTLVINGTTPFTIVRHIDGIKAAKYLRMSYFIK